MDFKRILKRLSHQWQVKLYLFFLAVLLWGFVVINKSYETVVSVDLIPINVQDGKLIVSEIPEHVKVRFTGTGKDLILMQYVSKPRLELNMETIQHFYDYPLRVNQVILSPDLEAIPMTVISPETVKVVLEDMLVRRVRIVPNIDVDPHPGYTFATEPYVLPDTCTITGPRSIVRRMQTITTESYKAKDVKKSIREEIALSLPDSLHLSAQPGMVTLVAEMDKIAERDIKTIKIGVIRLPHDSNLAIDPPELDMRVSGPAKRLARLTADSIQVYVDFSKWNPETRECVPEFNLPEGIEWVQSNPEKVRIVVEVNTP